MQHSPISQMDLTEQFFLRGYAVDELPEMVVEDDLPFEFDPQHSCCHGSVRSENADAARCGCAVAAAGMFCVVAWLAFLAACHAVLGGIREIMGW